MVLWFFSFAKYLMYRDLDPATGPITRRSRATPPSRRCSGDGFPSEPPLCGDEDKIDPLISPRQMIHVTDADSSQAVVIEEVRRGRQPGRPGSARDRQVADHHQHHRHRGQGG